MGIFLLFGFIASAQALSYIDEIPGVGYIYSINPIPTDDVAYFLSVLEEDLLISKVENNDDPPGEGIGTVIPGGDNDFGLTTTATAFDDDGEAIMGEWSADVPILAFSLKADGYAILTILSSPATSGTWSSSLMALYDWINNNPDSKWYDGKDNTYFTPSLSNFAGHTPVPEPSVRGDLKLY